MQIILTIMRKKFVNEFKTNILHFNKISFADTSYCPVFWDGWGCWNYTRAGSRAYIPCPEHIKGFDTKREQVLFV